MALAVICDRCGQLYTPGKLDNSRLKLYDRNRKNNIDMYSRNYTVMIPILDLCDNCNAELLSWLESPQKTICTAPDENGIAYKLTYKPDPKPSDYAEAINVGKDEYWGYWWQCSKCMHHTMAESNYCPNCGARLEIK